METINDLIVDNEVKEKPTLNDVEYEDDGAEFITKFINEHTHAFADDLEKKVLDLGYVIKIKIDVVFEKKTS